MAYQHSIHCDCAECDEALHYAQMYWFIENSKPQGINMALPSNIDLEHAMAIVQEARKPSVPFVLPPDADLPF